MERMLTILRELTSLAGISGKEDNVAEAISSLCECDTSGVDSMGNLTCIKKGVSGYTIMVEAHMDEVGFIVRHIDDEGFIYADAVGGIDAKAIIGTEVVVHGKERLDAIVATPPPHIKGKKDAQKLESLAFDTGLDKQTLCGLVRIGDQITYSTPLRRISSSKVASKSIDNRAGCAVLCYLSQYLVSEHDIAYVFSSQEEVGARGPLVTTRCLRPSLSISVDTTHGDMPSVAAHLTRKLGSGPVIGIGPNIHPMVSALLQNTARENSIPHTKKAYAGPTPTNLRTMQACGSPGGLVSIPARYLHTPAEIADLHDMRSTADLITKTVESVDTAFMEGLSCF